MENKNLLESATENFAEIVADTECPVMLSTSGERARYSACIKDMAKAYENYLWGLFESNTFTLGDISKIIEHNC